jgi:hypothetical protein
MLAFRRIGRGLGMNFRWDRIAATEIMRDLFFAILFLTELRANQQLKRHLFRASRA